jgi:hypothetical protein
MRFALIITGTMITGYAVRGQTLRILLTSYLRIETSKKNMVSDFVIASKGAKDALYIKL